MTRLPTPSTTLRRAIDTLVPMTVSSSVVSAVRREIISPVRVDLEEAGGEPQQCSNTSRRMSVMTRSPSHETKIEARIGRRRHHHDDREEGEQRLVERRRVGLYEALIDNALETLADDEEAASGQQQRASRGDHLPAVRRGVAPQEAR